MVLLLASGSPRRADLLRAAGIPFESAAPDVDETPLAGESAEAMVTRLAAAKAQAVAAARPGRAVLGADTTVVIDGIILGKPVDAADAARMLAALSGRTHTVLTGVCLVSPEAPAGQPAVAATLVEFLPLSPDEVAWYVASGEPMDKAGGYAIQGLGSRFVRRIEGSYANVVGLPVELILGMCRAQGIQVS
jgi:septum formation protein